MRDVPKPEERRVSRDRGSRGPGPSRSSGQARRACGNPGRPLRLQGGGVFLVLRREVLYQLREIGDPRAQHVLFLGVPSPACRKRPFTTHADRLRPNPPIPVAGVFGRQTAHHGQHWGIPHGQPLTGLLTGQGEHGLSHPTLEAVVVHELLEQFGIILD